MTIKKITPIIKKTRMIEEKFEVCPHCNEEIREKSTFIDKDNYLYHRPCFEKGPIEHIKPMSSEELSQALGWGSKALGGSKEDLEAFRSERNKTPIADDIRKNLNIK